MNILEKLEDLILQATTERSHYYVAGTAKEAVQEIKRLQDKLQVINELTKGEGRVQ